MTTTAAFEHAEFCLPRPGEDAPRMEKYGSPRYSEQGQVVGVVTVLRCIECGNASYNGVQH